MSPKYHPELAGVGIESSWGLAKQAFRKLEDKTSQNFEAQVRHCLSDEILTIGRVRKFARRTRDYLHGYKRMKERAMVETDDETGFDLCERMKAVRKAHRCIMDIDVKFLNSC